MRARARLTQAHGRASPRAHVARLRMLLVAALAAAHSHATPT
jgi:hypothetical protein